MKKVIVETIPPPPPQEKHRIVTHLTGKELIAYITDSGTICLLFRISKDNPKQFGFCNLAYSDQSSPTFTGQSWHEAVKKAGSQRDLLAFDSYAELMAWIKHGTQKESTSEAEAQVHADIKQTVIVRRPLLNVASLTSLIDEIPPEDVDWNGSGQVNHTHKSMTALYEKINALVGAVNLSYDRFNSQKKVEEPSFVTIKREDLITLLDTVIVSASSLPSIHAKRLFAIADSLRHEFTNPDLHTIKVK